VPLVLYISSVFLFCIVTFFCIFIRSVGHDEGHQDLKNTTPERPKGFPRGPDL